MEYNYYTQATDSSYKAGKRNLSKMFLEEEPKIYALVVQYPTFIIT